MVKKILIVLILLSLLIISVSANGPLPQTYLHVRIINIPEDAYYADLLIETNETDKSYSELEVDNTDKFEISEDSEIVKYNKDGYRSFTFHYKNAQSMIKIYSRDQLPDYMQDDYEEETGYVDFAYDPFDSDNNLLKDQYYDIKKNFTKIMIAITDKEGNILTISDKTDLSTKSFEYLYGWLTYDAASGNVEVNRKSSNFSFFFDIYILIFLRFIYVNIIGIFATVLIETLTALFFKMKPIGFVIIVNLISQIIMRILGFVSPMEYIVTLIILEVIVYISELYTYRKLYKDISIRKLLVFTVTANTLSLILGSIVNYFILKI